MTRSLTLKLTLAFLLVALTAALLVAALIRLASGDQLDQLIIEQRRSEFISQLAQYYEATGSWAGVEDYLRQYRGGLPDADPPPNIAPSVGWRSEPRRDRREFFGLADAQGRVIIPVPPDLRAGAQLSTTRLTEGEPITVDGEVVGTVLTAEGRPGLNPEEMAFLQRTNVALLLASAGAVLVALVVGGWLARTLTRPLRALTEATHRMAGGELEQAVAVKSKDEIGELAQAFNTMSREVARANNARKQMTADVAHELRTPLTVIAGHVEAMRDGVLPVTPERLAVIYSEIEHLQHLVGDLRTLSQADAGELKLNPQPIAPAELLEQARAMFEPQAAQQGVALQLEAGNGLPTVHADDIRITQVLSNLLTNALRYTPPGGRITLMAAAEGSAITFSVQDTGPGIAPADLPHIFDRFYRADQARSAEGESGLGLAIAKAVVEAHGGRIWAESAPGHGARIGFTLPSSLSP